MGAITAVFTLAIAFIFYGAGPLYLASERKKPIRKIHYWIFCVLYDAVIFVVFQLIAGSSISLSGLAVTMLLFGTIFYFIGLAILRKSGMVAAPPAQPAAPQPLAEPEASTFTPVPSSVTRATPTQPVSPSPITETWYTCPSCGCLAHTGEVCACGYHPPKAEPLKTPAKKQKWPIVAVAVLAIALACSVFYNAEQRNEISQAQMQLNSKQETINNYADTVRSLREQANSMNSYIDAVSFYASRACVVSNGSNWYHRDPTCTYCDLSYFWIYNVEQAVSLGYYQCPHCSALSPSGKTSSYLQHLIEQNNK